MISDGGRSAQEAVRGLFATAVPVAVLFTACLRCQDELSNPSATRKYKLNQ